MKILVVDNFDSFVYNLVHYLEGMGAEVTVVRNTEEFLSIVDDFDKILLSPGPGLPAEAGKMMSLLEERLLSKSFLGVCLGHQALGVFFGMALTNLETVKHGVSSDMFIEANGRLFVGLPKKSKVGRYHSWVIDKNSLNENVEIVARDEEGEIMALQHKELPIYGVQFHPESILTEFGKEILQNWLND